MLVTVAILTVCTFNGLLLGQLLDRSVSMAVRAATGLLVLVASAALITFGFACLLGLEKPVLILAGLIVCLPSASLLNSRYRLHLMHNLRGSFEQSAAGRFRLLRVGIYSGLTILIAAAFAAGIYL